MPAKQRISHFDLLKFFAIASVILGHSVEQTTGNDFWTNPIWSFIYSYHMPLFMLICGYFSVSALKRSPGELLRRKSIQLLIPSATMTVLIYGFITATGYNPAPEIFGIDFTSVINVLWFLKCVFLCYAVAYISIRLTRKTAVAAIASSVLFTILPGGDIVNLNFMLPMFWTGYALNRMSDGVERHRQTLLSISSVMFAVMLCFWSGTLTVYAVPIAVVDWHTMSIDLPNLGVTIYRAALGASGSLMFFLLAPAADSMVRGRSWYPTLLAIGRATLGIYVVQTLIVECGIHMAGIYLTTAQSFAVTPVLAVCGMAVCYMCVVWLRKGRMTRLLLLGETTPLRPRMADSRTDA